LGIFEKEEDCKTWQAGALLLYILIICKVKMVEVVKMAGVPATAGRLLFAVHKLILPVLH
jgi:hypothetical protein